MLANRMARELKMLAADPPPGVAAWPVGDSVTELRAQIRGPRGTVYERGVFDLAITVPPRYPLEPPKVAFTTPIHHPNIDGAGRICLDTLALPPKGGWRPALNLAAVLGSIRALLAEPNGDDGLVADVAHQFRHDRAGFDAAARAATARWACGGGGGGGAGPSKEGGEEEAAAQQQQQQQQQQQAPPPASAAASPPPRSRLQLGAKRARPDGEVAEDGG